MSKTITAFENVSLMGRNPQNLFQRWTIFIFIEKLKIKVNINKQEIENLLIIFLWQPKTWTVPVWWSNPNWAYGYFWRREEISETSEICQASLFSYTQVLILKEIKESLWNLCELTVFDEADIWIQLFIWLLTHENISN